jgi:hypothetical protein
MRKVTCLWRAVFNTHISLPSRWLLLLPWKTHISSYNPSTTSIMLHFSVLLHFIYVYVHRYSLQFSFLCGFWFNHSYFIPYFHYYTTCFGLTATTDRFVSCWHTDNALHIRFFILAQTHSFYCDQKKDMKEERWNQELQRKLCLCTYCHMYVKFTELQFFVVASND